MLLRVCHPVTLTPSLPIPRVTSGETPSPLRRLGGKHPSSVRELQASLPWGRSYHKPRRSSVTSWSVLRTPAFVPALPGTGTVAKGKRPSVTRVTPRTPERVLRTPVAPPEETSPRPLATTLRREDCRGRGGWGKDTEKTRLGTLNSGRSGKGPSWGGRLQTPSP